jgi:protein phosphatase
VPEIVIPDPSLVVLVGAAGAGKSTFAAHHFDAAEILSSDRYRGIVSGDETDQTATRAAFSLLHRDLARRLAAGLTTVVDATNIEPWARRTVVRRAHAAAVPAVAIVLDLPAVTVLARNATRPSRPVDVPVVVRHLARLRRGLDGPLPPILAEGFAAVVIIRDPAEVDDTTIRRMTRAGMDLPG